MEQQAKYMINRVMETFALTTGIKVVYHVKAQKRKRPMLMVWFGPPIRRCDGIFTHVCLGLRSDPPVNVSILA